MTGCSHWPGLDTIFCLSSVSTAWVLSYTKIILITECPKWIPSVNSKTYRTSIIIKVRAAWYLYMRAFIHKIPLQLEQQNLSIEDEGKCHASFYGRIKGPKDWLYSWTAKFVHRRWGEMTCLFLWEDHGLKDWLYFGKEEYNLFELSLCGDMIFGSTNLVGYPLAFIACI